MFKVAVIGCGGIAKEHIRQIVRIKNATLVGICDSNRHKANETARLFGNPPVFCDVSQLLETTRPSVVHVLTPPQSHKELSLQVMVSRSHVLVEKPMAVDVSEADQMISCARKHDVLLGVCHNRLYNPPVLEARRRVARGDIGGLVSVEVFCSHPASRHMRNRWRQWLSDLPGSVFHENAPHLVYLLMDFLQPLTVVSVLTKTYGQDPAFPGKELRVLFDGGSASASLCLATAVRPFRLIMNLYGTKGALRLDLATGSIIEFKHEVTGKLSKVYANTSHSLQLILQTASGVARSVCGLQHTSHSLLIRDFYRSIAEGTVPRVNGEDGGRVVEVLDQIWQRLSE